MDENVLFDKHNDFSAGEIPGTTNTVVPCGLVFLFDKQSILSLVYDSLWHICFGCYEYNCATRCSEPVGS